MRSQIAPAEYDRQRYQAERRLTQGCRRHAGYPKSPAMRPSCSHQHKRTSRGQSGGLTEPRAPAYEGWVRGGRCGVSQGAGDWVCAGCGAPLAVCPWCDEPATPALCRRLPGSRHGYRAGVAAGFVIDLTGHALAAVSCDAAGGAAAGQTGVPEAVQSHGRGVAVASNAEAGGRQR
jgi:hypothetical protein